MDRDDFTHDLRGAGYKEEVNGHEEREKTRRELTGKRRGWVVAQTAGPRVKKVEQHMLLDNHISSHDSRLVYVE